MSSNQRSSQKNKVDMEKKMGGRKRGRSPTSSHSSFCQIQETASDMSTRSEEVMSDVQKNALNHIRKQFQCYICKKTMQDPQCLPCRHNFCRDCVDDELSKQSPECPMCNIPLRPNDILRNQFLRGLVTEWHEIEEGYGHLFIEEEKVNSEPVIHEASKASGKKKAPVKKQQKREKDAKNVETLSNSSDSLISFDEDSDQYEPILKDDSNDKTKGTAIIKKQALAPNQEQHNPKMKHALNAKDQAKQVISTSKHSMSQEAKDESVCPDSFSLNDCHASLDATTNTSMTTGLEEPSSVYTSEISEEASHRLNLHAESAPMISKEDLSQEASEQFTSNKKNVRPVARVSQNSEEMCTMELDQYILNVETHEISTHDCLVVGGGTKHLLADAAALARKCSHVDFRKPVHGLNDRLRRQSTSTFSPAPSALMLDQPVDWPCKENQNDSNLFVVEKARKSRRVPCSPESEAVAETEEVAYSHQLVSQETHAPTVNLTYKSSHGTEARQLIHLVATGLLQDGLRVVKSCMELFGGKLTREFQDGITSHVVTKSVRDAKKQFRCKRTLKYMLGIAMGCLIVDYSWVEESFKAGKWLDPSTFEVTGDLAAPEQSLVPLRSRERLQRLNVPLLWEFNVYILGTFLSGGVISQQEMEHLVKASGCDPRRHDGEETQNVALQICLGVVSRALPASNCCSLWKRHCIPIVRMHWIFDCLSHCKVLPYEDYLACPPPPEFTSMKTTKDL